MKALLGGGGVEEEKQQLCQMPFVPTIFFVTVDGMLKYPVPMYHIECMPYCILPFGFESVVEVVMPYSVLAVYARY